MSQCGSGKTSPEPRGSGTVTPQSSDTRPKITLEPSSDERTGSRESLATNLHPELTQQLNALTLSTEAGTTQGSVGVGRSSRRNSPTRLPTELSLKYQSQVNRILILNTVAAPVPDDVTLIEIETDLEQVEEIHREFLATHTHFELHWPATFLDHEYFTENRQRQEALAYRKAKVSLKKAREARMAAQPPPAHSPPDSRHESKLPDIALPSFSGQYSDWPQFRELFSCLIMDCDRLSDVEKLHYLRSCMEAAPAQLIANFPLVGGSLQPSWELLTARYENKRLLIQAQLDKIVKLPQLTSKSAKGLSTLIAKVSEAKKALESLGVTDTLGDVILVHHVTHNLDRATREGWETSLGASTEYPSFARLEEFVNTRARALERIEATSNSSPHSSNAAPKKSSSAHQASNSQRTHQESSSYECDCCNGTHFVVMCPKFRNLDIPARRKLVTTNRLCFNCLGRHNANSCRSAKGCKHCGAKHHTMLHEATSRQPTTNSSKDEPTPTHPTTLLATAIAKVHSALSTHHVRILIDPGSELTFASEQLIKSLNVRRSHSSIPITGIGGRKATQTRGIVPLTLCSTQSNISVNIQAHVLQTVSSILPSFEARNQTWPHLTELRLADPDFLTPRPIDIILGADAYGQVIKPNLIKHSPSMPIAQLSIFGWLILGPVNSTTSSSLTAFHTKAQTDNTDLQELLTKFWIQEELPTDATNTLTPEEQECEDHFRTTHSRDSTGRYVVRIPLKLPRNLLGNSHARAHHCLQRMLKKLQRDDTLHELYTKFMREYEDLGHMTRASGHSSRTTHHRESAVGVVSGGMTLAPDASKTSGGSRVSLGDSSARTEPVYYLPHHGVLKPDSTTTKLRVVFNGSSSTTSGLSVNDLMHTGPNLLLEISDVLTWIRHHRHIFATDITKMYRQVKIHKDDWDLQRILWIDDELNEVSYQLTTVTYGTKAAPYLAVRALMQLVDDEGYRFPLAVPSLTHGRYVDDIFGGADSIDQLIKIAQDLRSLCDAGGFPLAKWQATDQALLTAISSNQEPPKTISFDDCSTKILGIKWLPRADVFAFTAKLKDHSQPITKRLILSEVAQIFDPLGFISPVTIRAKVLLQELWLQKINWDEPLPSHINTRWSLIREDLKNLAKISIPRWFNTWNDSTVELHGFSDASQLAMSAVVYIVAHSSSTGAKSSLVCAKTRVAPIKQLTIPRLELSAALLLSKLIKHAQATIQLPIASTHLWTDSQVALTWIKSPASRWKDYVRNRVTLIQELTPHAHWRHVPGTSNPADGPSRGLTAQQLKDHSLWWTGPPWMTQPMSSWPRQIPSSVDLSAHEARQGMALFVATPKIEYHWDLIYRFSTLSKLIRITSLCSKFIARMRRQSDSPLISRDEMEAARIFWIKATQAAYFSHELRSLKSNIMLPTTHVFSRLTAFLDHEGVIRVGGRLNMSSLNLETKHPAILPRQSRLSALIIDHSHRRTLHGGTQLTLADTRQSYWILGGRAPVKTHILRCIKCARQRGSRAQQLMGQLPMARVTPSRPFTHTGVDYAGPLTIKTWKGRGAKTTKGWICVFVCLTTSAVHLEAVSDYSTDGFIATYRRFISRRGIPGKLYSDCGTNFVGADKILRRMFTQSTHEHREIAAALSVDSTQWLFNPPAAPHMGGKWEAVVKSTKHHLRRTVGETVLTFEELTTLLSQIEAVLNSRPLEPLSDDPEDVTALTPGHFLTGDALSSLPEPSLAHLNITHLSRWQLIQQKLQSFWTHWTAHYLQRQQSISKWHHPSNNLKVGSLVLITDERFPPSKWPLARVTALHPGADGLTRVVTLKTATSTITRPISKLAPLPTHQVDTLKLEHHRQGADGGRNV